MKRIVSLLVAIFMIATLVPFSSTLAQDDSPPEAPPEAPPLIPPADEFDFEAQCPLKVAAASEDEPIDVLVVYTPNAKQATGAIFELVNSLTADTNQSFKNSNIAQRIRLIGVEEVAYPEVYPEGGGKDFWYQAIADLQKGEGAFGQVHSLREQWGADAVVLMLEDPWSYCGMAYLMRSSRLGHGFRDWAVSLVSVREGCTNQWTFAHELGHNFGAHHNPEVLEPEMHGAYVYSHGHRTLGPPAFRTIVAYGSSPQVRVLYWSSPDVTYQGLPTGIAEERDNVRTLNNTRPIVVNWRPRMIEKDVWLNTNIQPGSTLSGGTLVPEALVEVSSDGTNWVTAETDGNSWSVDWDVPFGVSEMTLYFRVNKGVPNQHTLTIGAQVTGMVSKVITATGGITTTALVNAAVSGGEQATFTDSDGSYQLLVPQGPNTINVFKAEYISPTLTMEYRGQAEIVTTAGVTHTLNYTLTGVPVHQHQLWLPIIAKKTPFSGT